jgi:hypothetical protein
MDILPGLVVLLATPNDELAFLNGYIELVAGKTCDRERDAQAFGLPVAAIAALDVVGRITVGAFDDAIEHTFDFVESQQERTG